MNIDLELYRIFYTVAKYENISKATKELYVSQPAITQRISNLENLLNVKLFNRKTGGMVLTKEGKELFKYIKSSIEIMNNVEERFSNYLECNKHKSIKIKSTNLEDNLFLSDMIVKFSKKYPDIGVNLELISEDEALKQLSNGETDIITLKDNGRLKIKNFEVIICKKLHFCLYTSKRYLEKQKQPIDIYNKVEEYNFILSPRNSLEYTVFDKFTKKYNLNVKLKYETESVNIRNYFVLNGLGISFGFREYIEKELKKDVFIEIPIKEEFCDCNVNWLMLKNKTVQNDTLKFARAVNS